MYAALGAGCDAVVFLVFNKFDSDCKTQTFGHEFGGVSNGGMCEQNQGRGYTVVVDQVQCKSVICEQDHPLTFDYNPTDTSMIVIKDTLCLRRVSWATPGLVPRSWLTTCCSCSHLTSETGARPAPTR